MFFTTYLALFLFSPLLDTGINYIDDSSIVKVSIFLLLVDVYMGYLHQSKYKTNDGYHLVHFVTLYDITQSESYHSWGLGTTIYLS